MSIRCKDTQNPTKLLHAQQYIQKTQLLRNVPDGSLQSNAFMRICVFWIPLLWIGLFFVIFMVTLNLRCVAVFDVKYDDQLVQRVQFHESSGFSVAGLFLFGHLLCYQEEKEKNRCFLLKPDILRNSGVSLLPTKLAPFLSHNTINHCADIHKSSNIVDEGQNSSHAEEVKSDFPLEDLHKEYLLRFIDDTRSNITTSFEKNIVHDIVGIDSLPLQTKSNSTCIEVNFSQQNDSRSFLDHENTIALTSIASFTESKRKCIEKIKALCGEINRRSSMGMVMKTKESTSSRKNLDHFMSACRVEFTVYGPKANEKVNIWIDFPSLVIRDMSFTVLSFLSLIHQGRYKNVTATPVFWSTASFNYVGIVNVPILSTEHDESNPTLIVSPYYHEMSPAAKCVHNRLRIEVGGLPSFNAIVLKNNEDNTTVTGNATDDFIQYNCPGRITFVVNQTDNVSNGSHRAHPEKIASSTLLDFEALFFASYSLLTYANDGRYFKTGGDVNIVDASIIGIVQMIG